MSRLPARPADGRPGAGQGGERPARRRRAVGRLAGRLVAAVLSVAGLATGVQAAETAPAAADGAALFEQHCRVCHSMRCNRVGPRLGDVIGRAAGAVPDFGAYSTELRYAGIVWNADELDALLAAPGRHVQRSWMEALVPIGDPLARRRLIAFLASGDASGDRCP